jgi:hypothetical protein
VNQVRSITAADFATDCPVPLELVARIIRADPTALTGLLDGIPEAIRARLAVWLYGRSHTHEIGVRIAATCKGQSLRREAGFIGDQLYEFSRRPYTAPSHGMQVGSSRRQISLAGLRGAIPASV